MEHRNIKLKQKIENLYFNFVKFRRDFQCVFLGLLSTKTNWRILNLAQVNKHGGAMPSNWVYAKTWNLNPATIANIHGFSNFSEILVTYRLISWKYFPARFDNNTFVILSSFICYFLWQKSCKNLVLVHNCSVDATFSSFVSLPC